MVGKFLGGLATGAGFIAVVAVAFAIAYAGDVFTIDKDGTLKFAVSDQGKITVGATESYVNLVIQNNSAAADEKVDIIADVLIVEGIRLETVSVSASLNAALYGQAGGLDTGAEAANAWYYIWVITDTGGTQRNGLFSTSSISPTLPSGYTKKRRVGAVRNSGSTLYAFQQEGNKVAYPYASNILAGGTQASYMDVPAGTYIPPTSRRGTFVLDMLCSYSNADTAFWGIVRKKGYTGTGEYIFIRPVVANKLMHNSFIGDFDTDANQYIQYLLESSPGGRVPTAGGLYINVRGYYDRI